MTAPPLEAALFMIGSALFALGTHQLIWRRLIRQTSLPTGWQVTARRLLTSLGLLFPIGMLQLLLMRHVPHVVASPVMWAVFTWLGLIVFLVWAALVFDLLRFVARPAPLMECRLARLCVVLAVALAVFSLAQAQAKPIVLSTHLAVTESLAGYRIAQLSDLHIGPTLEGNFARDVTQQVNSLNADLIVISGDLVDGSVAMIGAQVAPLAGLRAKDGVVFVLGNHEYLSGADEWVRHAESFGWHVLRDARLTLPRLDVIGVDEFSPVASRVEQELSRSRPTIVVSHTPRTFEASCHAGVDIALAGHTHGGQVFPFGILEWLQQGYLAGPYHCGNTQLYVSSGTGYWGPPMRLGTRSEISLIELISADAKNSRTVEDSHASTGL